MGGGDCAPLAFDPHTLGTAGVTRVFEILVRVANRNRIVLEINANLLKLCHRPTLLRRVVVRAQPTEADWALC